MRELLAQMLCNLVDHGQPDSWGQIAEGEKGNYREDADMVLNLVFKELKAKGMGKMVSSVELYGIIGGEEFRPIEKSDMGLVD